MTKLVHIHKIEFIDSSDLSGMKILTQHSCRIPNGVNFCEIESLSGLVGAKTEDTMDDGEKVYTTTVTFQMKCKMPTEERRVAFRLTSIDGNQFLVGTDIRPYPVIKENNPYPEKPGDSVLKQVTVTWKSPYPMLLIL